MSGCFMIRQKPSIEIAYICVTNGQNSAVMARHFVDTYRQFPAGANHHVTVICNGGALPKHVAEVFNGTGFDFYTRSNDGFDIGAYLEFSRRVKPETALLVCFGESVHFHRSGWLARIEQEYNKSGPGMYGFFSSFLTRAHMNTTAFAITPQLLHSYPRVLSHADRYGFEHGPWAMWRRVAALKLPTKFVTWNGVWDPPQWRTPKNILWTGDQSELLVWCNHTDRYFAANPNTRYEWERGANRFVG